MEDHIELFRSEDARTLLTNKYVLFIGDSGKNACLQQSSLILKALNGYYEHHISDSDKGDVQRHDQDSTNKRFAQRAAAKNKSKKPGHLHWLIVLDQLS